MNSPQGRGFKPRNGYILLKQIGSFLLSNDIIGSGTYGEVVFSKSTTTGTLYACKKCPKYEKNGGLCQGTVRELLCLQSIPPHPNLITAHQKPYIGRQVTYQPIDLMKINVKSFLRKTIHFQPVHAIYITKSICQALMHMRLHGWVHRDVKLENILIGFHGEIKLCDFSLARLIQYKSTSTDSDTPMTSYVCTRYTRPPECFYQTFHHAYTDEVDIFSLGMCLLAMLNGGYAIKESKETHFKELMNLLGTNEDIQSYYSDLPFQIETKYEDLTLRLRKFTRYLGVETIDKAILQLLTKMLHPVPSKRISYADLDQFLSRFTYTDAKVQLKDCVDLLPTIEPIYIREIICPMPIKSTENSFLAKSTWMYCALQGIHPGLAFYITNQMHLTNSIIITPQSVLRIYAALFNIENIKSEIQFSSADCWDVLLETTIDYAMYEQMNTIQLSPFVQCIFAAALSLKYHSKEDIDALVKQASKPESMFEDVKAKYVTGFCDFFKKYKNHFPSQESVYKSWIRLHVI